MSKANRSTLQSIYTNLGEFLDKFPEEEQEETEVTKKEIEDTVAAASPRHWKPSRSPRLTPSRKPQNRQQSPQA